MRVSRRRFLALAGTTAAGAAVGGYLGSLVSSPPRLASFRSRPDLHPPLIDVTTDPPLGPGYAFVTPAGPMIVDDTGSPIWVHPVIEATTNLQVQQYRGVPVLTWWQGRITSYGTGEGEGVLADSSYREIARVRAGNGLGVDLHELELTDRGTAYITVYQVLDADLRPVGGPRQGKLLEAVVQEIDIATGKLLFEWRASDHVSLTESHLPYSGSQPYDPVHLNSIEELADGHLLLSARNTWALYKVSRATGEIVWRLGGKRSDFSLGEGARFAWQHDARSHGDGSISLFDDEALPAEAPQSRALFLALDEEARHATVARSYLHTTGPLLAGSQGSVQLLEDGQVFVGWGARPYYTQYRKDGTIVLDAHILKGFSYRAIHSNWTGTPTELPAVAVQGTRGGPGTVFASWNGSTETTRWRLLGGPDPARLEVLGSARRSGFETEVPLRRIPAHLAVQALSASGAVLSSSRTVAT